MLKETIRETFWGKKDAMQYNDITMNHEESTNTIWE